MPPDDEIAEILRALIERRRRLSEQILRAQRAMRRADEVIHLVQARFALIRGVGKYQPPDEND